MAHRRFGMRVFAALALLGAAALPTAGCSPVSYPSMFPTVEQSPPPRADAPMDANQVQQATEDLLNDRNRLNGQSQANEQPAAAGATPAKTSAAGPSQLVPAAVVSSPASGQ